MRKVDKKIKNINKESESSENSVEEKSSDEYSI
jgi:hypothetical protein